MMKNMDMLKMSLPAYTLSQMICYFFRLNVTDVYCSYFFNIFFITLYSIGYGYFAVLLVSACQLL